MGIEYTIEAKYETTGNRSRTESLGLFVELFVEKPVYRGLEEANKRLRAKGGYDLTLLSSPTACGTYGLDDS